MRVALTLALLVASGCAKSTELLVVLTTDLDLPAESNAFTLLVAHPGDGPALFSKTYSIPSETLLPASLDLRGSHDAATVQIDATLLLEGALQVTRRAVVPFEPDHALLLRLALDRDCIGVVCSDSTTCVAGACVSPVVDSTTLPPIGSGPLGGFDAGPPVDGMRTSDASTGVDASTPDAGCLPPTLPPKDPSCRVYTVTDTSSVMEQPGNGGSTPSCGRRVITMSAGATTYGTEYRLLVSAPTSISSYTLTASYTQNIVGVGWVGLSVGTANARYEVRTREPLTMASGEDAYQVLKLANDGDEPPVSESMTTRSASHRLALSVVPTGSMPGLTCSSTVDDVDTNTPSSVPLTSAPAELSFFVGGESGGTGATLDWLELCVQAP